MTQVAFRDLGVDDLPLAGEIYADAFNASPWNEHWSRRTAALRLESLLHAHRCVARAAELEGRMVGFAIGHAEPWSDGLHFYLNELAVHRAHVRRGVGTAILRDLGENLRDRDVRGVFLLTERATPAHDFFVKNGFEQDEQARKLWMMLA